MLLVRAVWETIALRKVPDRAGREYDMSSVASYVRDLGQPFIPLPPRAWTDLDMDDVFQRIDRTASWPGQQLLYARLRREDHSLEELQRFDAGVTCLADDVALRTKVRTALEPLDDWRVSLLPVLFQGPEPTLPPIARVFPLLSVIGIVGLVAAFWWPPLVVAIFALAVVNALVRVALRERIDHVVPAMRMLPAMLRASRTLAALGTPALSPYTDALRQAVPRLHWIARAARWFSFDPRGGNELAGYVYEYLNLLLLLDVTAFVWSIGAIRAERDTIGRAYVAMGELDTRQAIATLRAEHPRWTRPAFDAAARRSLSFVALTHPLLDAPVPNSLEIAGPSVLLTGSNMSGKSTFIRTVGVNAVLAGTIYTVFAERWRAPKFAVRTSIGRADGLLEGKSYYQAEVDAVGALLAPSSGEECLVLIDELFRGTNSIERVAAAKAVLAQLDRGDDVVIVATHDVELLELLPAYTAYHFREEVDGKQLTFDYQLRSGACSTRNALAILALAGYPAAVVEDARLTASRAERRVIGTTSRTT